MASEDSSSRRKRTRVGSSEDSSSRRKRTRGGLSEDSSSRRKRTRGGSSEDSSSRRKRTRGGSSVYVSTGLCELIDVSDPANPQKCGSMILKNARDIHDKVPFYKRVVLTFIPEGPGIVGEGVKPLHDIFNEVARDSENFPVGVKDWKLMPVAMKDYVIKTKVLTKFYIEPRKYEEVACYEMKQQIGHKWKYWKSKVWNENYDETKSRKENEEAPPDGITKDDWACLIAIRFSEAWLEMRERNRENALMQDCHPTSGSRPVGQLYGLMAAQNGENPSRTEVVLVTRCRDDGSYPNDSVRDVMENIRVESQHEGVERQGRNDAVARVLGEDHCGRVRGFGPNGSQSRIFGPNKRYIPPPSFESDSSSCPYSNMVTREEYERQQQQLAQCTSKLNQCTSLLNFVITQNPEQMQKVQEDPQYRNLFSSSPPPQDP